MYEVQDALENQKARFMKDEEQFRKKEEQLRAKDLQLQHQLYRFNKFLQDNEAKRRRAETRAAEEAAQIRQREEEIQELELQLAGSKQECEKLEEEVTRNMKYEVFLESVKETCDDYQEIQDLVTRYYTLESANRDLMELQTASVHRIEELRKNFQHYRKEQEMEMLELTNRIASLSQELDDSQKSRQQLMQQVDEVTREDSTHSLEFGRILMSVENIFLRCTTKRKNIRHDQDDEFSKSQSAANEEEVEDSFKRKQQIAILELKVILAYLKDFKAMVEKLKKEVGQRGREARQGNVQEAVRPPEPKIEVQTEQRGGGDRGSQNSGSQGNTREISRGARDVSAGASGAVAAAE